MLVYSHSTASFIDLYGANIIVNTQTFENGKTETRFKIIGYGVGFQLELGSYPTEIMARQVLEAILKAVANNDDFFDMKSVEDELFKE